jgi:hypothetical protein
MLVSLFLYILSYDLWAMFILNLFVGCVCVCVCVVWIVLGVEYWWLKQDLELCDLVMMGWLSKLIVVDNLECPKYKWNSTEILIEFFTKKQLPSN